MTTEEGNKLIAEFMGYAYYPKDTLNDIKGVLRKDDKMSLHAHVLDKLCSTKYHSSWDWLMPVVEKIASFQTKDEEVIYNGEGSYFDTFYPRTFAMIDSQTKEFMVRINRFSLHKSEVLIEATWLAVVNFIEFQIKNL